MNWTESLGMEYLSLWNTATIRSEKLTAVKDMATRVLSKKSRYEAVAKEFGCPWWWVGLVHAMESGCDFSTWLANGDPLSSPTTHVPKGLQCNGTWEDGARVSLRHHGMPPADAWSLARCFYEWEAYNGFGYRSHGDVSDYLWSFTNHERAGRYVSDGQWSPTAWSSQPSCGAMLKYLVEIGAVSLSSGQVSVDDRVTWLELHRLEENGVVRTGCAAYAAAEALVTWDGTDKGSLLQFAQRFKNANAVLVAGADKPWPTLKPVEKPVVEKFLKLQRTGTKEEKGCEVLLLTLEGTNHAWYVRSGQPHAQVFQKGGPENVPGSMMPLPGGEYSVGDIQWAKKDDYEASLGAGLGPLFVPVEPQFQTRRSAFGIHADTGAYGTAGCIGLRNLDDLKRLVSILREYDPRKLVVAWGL